VPVVPVRDNVHYPDLIATLLVGREMSVRALETAHEQDRLVLVLGQRDTAVEEPSAKDLHRIGCLSEVVQVLPMPDGTMRAVLRGLARCRVEQLSKRAGFFRANVELEVEPIVDSPDIEALRREAVDVFTQVAGYGKLVAPEALEMLPGIENAGQLADTIANQISFSLSVKQALLEELDPEARLREVVRLLISERQVLELQTELRAKVERELGNTQREYYLREQLRAIQTELDGPEEFGPETEALHQKLQQAQLSPETFEKLVGELRRLERAASNSPEGMVLRTYLETIASLPWNVTTEDRLDVKEAAKILDAHHFGLEKVKDRVLDYLAVRQLSQSLRGPILCFLGPPGVGKTSLGRSIAEALGRKFVRISLGGVRDEAEIRGHRRTYVGAMPGRVLQSLRTVGTRNPVVVLDEIDKVASDFRGDPASALLELLDPEQNSAFVDHYVEVPFDLSTTMFILTANAIESIPPALRDRMEFIHFPSYTEDEKLHIGVEHLLPRLVEEHGLVTTDVALTEAAQRELIQRYTREAGVRALGQKLSTICRKVARRRAEGIAPKPVIDVDDLPDLLGHPRYTFGQQSESDLIGAATGLVYTEVGGDVLTIEVSLMASLGTEPNILLTGSLGDVMKESCLTAVSYLRSRTDEEFHFDVHVHAPAGAVPKDGPSAGVTILTALTSALTGKSVRRDIAMTGELTLRGRVLPIGGLREKVLAAHRAGIRDVILPRDNERDLSDVPENVRAEMQFHLVSTAEEVITLALRA
jgi:ATP-dependent Lon protease